MSKIRKFCEALVVRFRGREQAEQGNVDGLSKGKLVPESSQEAHERLLEILDRSSSLPQLSHEEFMQGWIAMAYIAPALDPDDAGTKGEGWPSGWVPVAAEAFRRFEAKELDKEELYPRVKSCL